MHFIFFNFLFLVFITGSFCLAGNKEDIQLLDAVKSGRLENVIAALKNGAQINAKDQDGETALIKASVKECPDIVDYLSSQKGIDFNARTKWGSTAMHFAARRNNGGLKILVKHRELLDLPNDLGFTPIFWAIDEQNSDNVRLLLQNGANKKYVIPTDKPFYKGMTALQFTEELISQSEERNSDVTELLKIKAYIEK